MRLDSIHIILKEYIEEQEKLQSRWPCDAEYIITPEDRDRNAMNSKRESHAHRYYSHNW